MLENSPTREAVISVKMADSTFSEFLELCKRPAQQLWTAYGMTVTPRRCVLLLTFNISVLGIVYATQALVCFKIPLLQGGTIFTFTRPSF